MFDDWGPHGGDVWRVRADSGGEPELLINTPGLDWGGELSPDGRWLAYTSDFSGQYQVYVEPFPATGERFKISTHDTSEEPAWSPDGRELYYRSGTLFWAVPIRTTPTFSAGRPELVLGGAYLNVGGRSYDVHPTERRTMLVIDSPDEVSSNRIDVITNWVAELRRLVR